MHRRVKEGPFLRQKRHKSFLDYQRIMDFASSIDAITEMNKYTGYRVKDGKLNGVGIYTFANGEIYEGEIRDNERNGQGIQMWVNGNKYTGEWKNDKADGKGILHVNGDKYSGDLVNGKMEGLGVYTWGMAINMQVNSRMARDMAGASILCKNAMSRNGKMERP